MCWQAEHQVAGATTTSDKQITTAFKDNILIINAGDEHTCAISFHYLECWGNNHFGQTNILLQFRKALSVSGNFHTLASAYVDGKNQLRCFGTSGQNECDFEPDVDGSGDFQDVKAA